MPIKINIAPSFNGKTSVFDTENRGSNPCGATNLRKIKEKKMFRDKLWNSWIYNLYRYSWLYRLRWFIVHWWRKDHWIKTNLPIGYHDKVNLLEDGIFSLVSNFMSRDDEDAPSHIVIEENMMEKISSILHFYHIDKPKLVQEYNDLLHDIYKDYHINFFRLTIEYTGNYSQNEVDEKREELYDLEKKIWDLTQKKLKDVINIRGFLWS